ncbi:DUF2971 domain-containing protein [Vibrio chagasii]|uniref:DUF2971 domain-containing protein n=1 Tax=Vibrio chagasii TaxID=170679 RepID=UPI003383354E|nr:conserved hypothetical protein [Vibrio chagasii]CAH7190762.1 conserved hypothetical protein [Vibrio chagasii]
MFKEKLFRFRSFSQFSLLELNNRTMWFSDVESFNDPFEFRFNLDLKLPKDREKLIQFLRFTESDLDGDHKFTKQDIRDFILKYDKQLAQLSDKELHDKATELIKNDKKERIENTFEKHKTKVCCLSKTFDDPLMWAHYTDGMKGFAIIYNEFLTREGKNIAALNVNYVDDIPIINYKDFRLKSSSDGLKLNTKMLASKHKRWSYEQEIRFFSSPRHPYSIMRNVKLRNKGVMDLPDNAIFGVIVGCKMSVDNLKIIHDICNRSGYKLYKANLKKENYQIDITPIG